MQENFDLGQSNQKGGLKMKKARDQEVIKTIPDGVYECGILKGKREKQPSEFTTDAQGNGYPAAENQHINKTPE